MEKVNRPFFIIILAFIILINGCGKSSGTEEVLIPAPGKAALMTPANNQPCISGIYVSATQTKVAFTWQSAEGANSYTIGVKNLLTGVVNEYKSIANVTDITLSTNTPYSWYVTSESTKTILNTKSDIWKFYNSGTMQGNYAPFPADIVQPALNANVSATTGKTTLQWTGTDADNDALTYDVYFGTAATPPLLKGALSTNSFEVNISSGATYYWKIISIDLKGSSSDSGVFKFTAN